MPINKESFRSPEFAIFVYVAAGCLFILGFRLIYPGEAAPLPIFSQSWRLNRSLLEIISLFPALVFSALAIPFCIFFNYEDNEKFSPAFFQQMKGPVVSAIIGAVIFSLLFFLVLPLARSSEEDMRYKGELYRMAKEQAGQHREAGEWVEASQFLGICDSVWHESPDLESLRAEIQIHLDISHYAKTDSAGKQGADVSNLPGQRDPVNAADAIHMGEAALREGRLLDAHWLATLAGRIAREGSLEVAAASRLAARAWGLIETQQPDSGELNAFSLYRLKLSGYQAMVSGDWIRAFYIFNELADLAPYDPDARNYLVAAENGTKELAFFIDEMNVSPGETLTGAIFSLPLYHNGMQGRSVLRLSSLSTAADFAYGTGIEYMSFNSQSDPLLSLNAEYAKITPIVLDGRRQVLMQMRMLDRHDSSRSWEPEWEAWDEGAYHPESAQITLDVPFETFLMLADMRRGLAGMQIYDLFAAARVSGNVGYIAQVFESEILNRLGTCLFFLPMCIAAIIIGWRFRAIRFPRYLFVPILPALPIVFNGLVYLYHVVINIICISLVIATGFSAALTIFIIIMVASLVISLILLAAQHN